MAPIRSQPYILGSRPSPLSGGSSNHGSLVRRTTGGSQDSTASSGLMGTTMNALQGAVGHGGRTLIHGSTFYFNTFNHNPPVEGPETAHQSPRSIKTYFPDQSHRSHTHNLSDAMMLLYQRSAPAAAYNAKERFDPPKCHHRTRMRLLNTIHNWVNGYNTELDALDPDLPPFTWLYGSAGAGKSAIAQTTSEDLSRLGNLAASFFFSRTAPVQSHRGDESRFVTTLAYQLTEVIPSLRPYIDHAIANRLAAFDLTLSEQVMVLIMEPLSQLKRDNGDVDLSTIFAKVIVVDGLDECKTEAGQKQVLDAIATLVGHPDIFPFFVLLASRPEVTIRSWVDATRAKHPQPLQSTSLLDYCDADHDIEVFVNDEAAEIRRSHPFKSKIPASWPPTNIVKEIVKRASGQFIYAATVMKYVKHLRDHPARRLENLLQNTIPDLHRPYAELDALYVHILEQTEHPVDVHRLLAFRLVSLSFSCYLYVNGRDDDSDLDAGSDAGSEDGSEDEHRRQSDPFDYSDIGAFLERFLSLPCSVDALLIDLQSIISSNINCLAFAGGAHDPVTERLTSLNIGVPSLFHHASFLEFLLDPRRSKEFYVDIRQYDKKFTEIALQQIKDSSPDPSNATHILYCFLTILQSRTSHDPPYSDQFFTQLLRWDTLDGVMLDKVIKVLSDLSCILTEDEFARISNPAFWTTFTPVVLRKRAQCQQALQRAGIPREVLVLHEYAALRFDMNVTFYKSIACEILTSTRPYNCPGVDLWNHPSVLHTFNDDWQSQMGGHSPVFGNIIKFLDGGLGAEEKDALQFEEVKRSNILEKTAAAVLYIRNITSMLDPSKEAEKPKEMRAYFESLHGIRGEHWRALTACQYLDQSTTLIWSWCPLSADIVSALYDLSNCLFPLHVVADVEGAFFPLDLPNSHSKTQYLSSWSSPCTLPRLFMLPDHFVRGRRRIQPRCLGILHDYIRLYHLWNTQTTADQIPLSGIAKDNMLDLWLDSDNTNEVDISSISARKLLSMTKDPETGSYLVESDWSLGSRIHKDTQDIKYMCMFTK